MFKRVGLFLLTNLGIMIVIGIVVNVFGLNRFLNENGLDLASLFVFSLVIGFTGSIISLLISKQMAKMAVGARVITNPANQEEPHRPEQIKAFGVNGKSLMTLFSTHPSLEDRIEKLRKLQ